MKRMKLAAVSLACALSVFAAQGALAQKPPAPADSGYKVGDRLAPKSAAGDKGFREISWDDLIPASWQPEKLFADIKLDDMQDSDPRAMELMNRVREEWDRAPVKTELNGQRIRIPGFLVPLETDGKTIREFLLVPYFGACVHVPPPPANQLIHVMPDKPVAAKLNMLPVWVDGVLTVARFESDLGNAGYQMRGIKVEEYKEPPPR